MPLEFIVTSDRPQCAVALLHGTRMNPQNFRAFLDSLGVPGVFCLPAGPVVEGDGKHSWWPVDAAEQVARLARGPADLLDRHPAGREAAREALDEVLHEMQRRH